MSKKGLSNILQSFHWLMPNVLSPYIPISTFSLPLLIQIGEMTTVLCAITILFPKCEIQSQQGRKKGIGIIQFHFYSSYVLPGL